MRLLVILLGAVWHCNAYNYFPVFTCYYINRSLCLGLNEQIFVSGHCLLGDAWSRFSQVTCWDQMHLIKHYLKILLSLLKTFSSLNFWLVSVMFLLIICLFLPVFSYWFLNNLPFAQFLACSGDTLHHLLMICLFLSVYSNFCYITFSYTGKHLVFFFYPLDLWVLDASILFDYKFVVLCYLHAILPNKPSLHNCYS